MLSFCTIGFSRAFISFLFTISLGLLFGEVAVRSCKDFSWLSPDVPMHRVQYVDAVTRTHSPRAQLYVLGSSRAAYGISADRLARDLLGEGNRGVNLGFYALSGRHFHEIISRSTDRLRPGDLVLLVMDDYFLTNDDPPDWNSKIQSWLQDHWRFKTSLPFLWRQFVKSIRGIPLQKWHPYHSDGHWIDPFPPRQSTSEVVRTYFQNRSLSQEKFELFSSLIDRINDLGARVVLVDLPKRIDYELSVKESFEELNRRVAERLDQLAVNTNSLLIKLSFQSCQLQDEDFRDSVHPSSSGTLRTTTCLSQQLYSSLNKN